MYQKKSSIIIKTIKYKLIFCDTQALLIFIQSNVNYKKSLIEIMKKGTDKYFDILNLVIKNYSETETSKKNVKYLLIYNNEEILTISRVIYDKKKGYIDAVNTNKNFRGNKLCQRSIKKLITLTYDIFNVKIFELEVDVDNIPAIKCYKNCGFNIMKQYNDIDGVPTYKMMIKIIVYNRPFM